MENTNKKITMEDLALMLGRGFNGVDEKFKLVEKKLTEHDKRFDTLEQGHEDIKLRLDNVAYRFELVELQKRVDVLGKKVGVRHK